MIFVYRHQDDRYEKEGDLAREGFVHILTAEGDVDERNAMRQWCTENITQGWLTYSCGALGICYDLMYFKSIEEVVLVKMMWA
jgi:hypothetical protein